ncbi:GNAT family N-acetyltransferase [Rhizosphaericola mali]|uniref:GNAT family N-acetyltransferase n=1 Tax=Rhizosphaericola mali TaxID=2545455 RepID=A0A5P2G8J1_9BACT|nr:GNAT family N-acetyltransferase [Rhizosphaericola mali]QES90242.1 GNAT family N-acetyltransferase [Rhizosphaericola mali]
MNLQPTLQIDKILLRPLEIDDFEELYLAASDPLVWEQHPNKDRYKREVFQSFFDGAIQSKGAFAIIDTETNTIIGSSRYYDFDAIENSILIGYTFYKRDCWGKGINSKVKKLMLDYIFQYVDKVYLHVGATNFRSQKAVERIGGIKLKEEQIAYFGENPSFNFIYQIKKDDFI